MNVRFIGVRAMECMCAQTRSRFILSSERVFKKESPNPYELQGEKKPSIGKVVLRGGWNPRRCIKQDSESNTLPTSYSGPHTWVRVQPPPCVFVSRASHTTDLDGFTPEAGLPGAGRYRVSAGTGWPGVSILCLGEIESLICSFDLSVAAHTILSELVRPWDTLACCKQPTNNSYLVIIKISFFLIYSLLLSFCVAGGSEDYHCSDDNNHGDDFDYDRRRRRQCLDSSNFYPEDNSASSTLLLTRSYWCLGVGRSRSSDHNHVDH